MSSWTTLQAGKRIPVLRGGYYQDVPEGRFSKKSKPATVVSAFYELSTKKYTKDQYSQWIKNFLSLPTHLVFFCEESFAEFVKEYRKGMEDHTAIYIVPREDWTMRRLGGPSFWKSQATKDPDNRLVSEEVYMVWLEKKEFVKRAIQENPFKHTDFVWCDAGGFREEEMLPYFQDFPVADRIPADRMLIGNVQPFTRSDEKSVVISFDTLRNVELKGGNFQRPRLAAGILAGSKESWAHFDTLFNSVLEKYLSVDWFIGSEQNIIANCVMEEKEFWSLVDAKPIYWDRWFCAFVWMSVNGRMLEVLKDKKMNGTKRTREEFLKLLKDNQAPPVAAASVAPPPVLAGGAAAAARPAPQPLPAPTTASRPLRQVVL
jgi:hypothetical protein